MDKDEILEKEIGSVGTDHPTSLGKVSNRVLGGKETLADDEKASLEAFKEKVNKDRQKKQEVSISDGWIPLDRKELGQRSLFYPESWTFYIKPATVMAVKNWSAVDEDNTGQVNKVMNDIIRTSVKIETEGVGASWAQINSWDRFFFILKVRELTFANGETKIEFEDTCSECDQNILYKLESSSLFYDFPDDEVIEKHWYDNAWNIDPTEYDVNHEPITLYIPKLKTDEAVINWATAKAQAKHTIDETFVRFLMWMIPNPSKDIQVLNKQIEKLYKEYKSWSVEMFNFVDDVITNISINPSEKLRCTCPNCGGEATSTVRFPNGLNELFKTKSGAKKFGSRTR